MATPWKLLIFPFLLQSFACDDIRKSSLVFVIDSTGSMQKVINDIKEYVNRIFDAVLDTEDSQIENFVLVTFNEPFVRKRIVTPDRDAFKEALDNIYAFGGVDCPEYSMSGIELGLQLSLPRSQVYVFTDASAKDYQKYEEVKNLAQHKSSQIIFALTNKCINDKSPEMFLVYEKMAAATSGHLFYLWKQNINEILDWLVENVKGRTALLAEKNFSPGHHNISFFMDEHTPEAFILATGKWPKINVVGPSGKRLRSKTIVRKSQNTAIKGHGSTRGTYMATIESTSNTNVTVTAKTTIDFVHGFSTSIPTSIEETSIKPLPDVELYLLIDFDILNGEQVKLTGIQLLDLEGNVLLEKALRIIDINNRLYVTVDKFKSPKQMFNIMISGYIVATKDPVYRIAPTPIVPESAAPRILDNGKTEYTASARELVLKIPCRATGYPKPTITWKADGKTILKGWRYSINENELVVRLPNLNYIREYRCIATNRAGEDSKTFKGFVEAAPRILDSGETEYTASARDVVLKIPCRATGYPKPTIAWKVDGNTISEGSKYTIMENELIILSPNLNDICEYTCTATNRVGGDTRTFRGFVEAAPCILDNGKTKYTASARDVVLKIPCRATGYPKPTITWKADGKTISEDSKYSIANNKLIIHSPNLNDIREYTCTATNRVGGDNRTFRGFVEAAPRILDNGKKEYTASALDIILEIPCIATGYPKPTITWKVDGKTISEGSKYLIIEDALIIHSPNLNDIREYTCTATNRVGGDTRTFRGFVEAAPLILNNGKTEYTATARDVVLKIPCNATGYPKPTIMWTFDGKTISEDSKYSIMEDALIINSPNLNDIREYTCTATNRVGGESKTFKGFVEVAPRIIDSGKTVYTAITGDVAMKIPCNATGYPKPTISWKAEEIILLRDSKYLVKEDALIVRSPNTNDSLAYTCTAKNKVGEDNKTFQGIVEDGITGYDKVNNVYVLEGKVYELKCQLPHSESDIITWFYNYEKINNSESHTDTIYVEGDVTEDGNYSCRVSNADGYVMDTYEVDFGFPPTFKAYQESEIVDWRGDGTMDCDVDAKPAPEIQWFYGGKPVDDYRMMLPIFGWGQYTCNVSNVHGSVTRTFNVTTSACLINKTKELQWRSPILFDENRNWLNGEIENDFFIIPVDSKIILSCQSQDSRQNSFRMLPGTTEVEASCIAEDKFLINGKTYKYSDLKCDRDMKPQVKRTGEQCLKKDTEWIQVGYQLKEFIEVYRVCFDVAHFVPLYSHARSINYNEFTGSMPTWFTSPGLESRKKNSYTCKESSTSCCIARKQLVDANDVAFGAAQRSTFIENLNTVPAWQSCEHSREFWTTIDMVLETYAYEEVLGVWSGASRYVETDEGMIPQYLWKVVKFHDDEPLVIIFVNDPNPKDDQVLCESVCSVGHGEWVESADKYTYCCKLNEFAKALDIPEDVFDVSHFNPISF